MNKDAHTPYEFIQAFRKINYGIDEDGTQRPEFSYLSKQLTQSIEQLSKGLYTKDIHFVLELIQNAEDNEYSVGAPELHFVLLDTDPTRTPNADGCLCIFNNETGFRETHVESICGIGQSTKTKWAGYIGEKGIGFKSVFVVSERPHIFSNGFQFHFREHDPDIRLAYVVPYWVDDVPAEVKSHEAATSILLPLKRGKRAEIDAELGRIAPETILFLSRLAGITVESPSTGRLELIRDSRELYVFDLLVKRDELTESCSTYWIHEETIPVPDDVVEEKRENVTHRCVSIAFPLSTEESAGRVFAYLPTEVDTGLPFLINADFLLSANRESIQLDKRWNQWLRNSLGPIVVGGIKNMLRHDNYRYHALSFVPLDRKLTGLKDFFAPVCAEILKALSNDSVVISDVNELIPPKAARTATRALRHLFPVSDRPAAFDKFTFCHPKLESYRSQLSAIGVKALSAEDLRNCFSDTSWIQRQPQGWFVKALSALKEIQQQKRQWISFVPIIPTEDAGWVTANSGVYFAADKKAHDRLTEMIQRLGLPPVNFLPESIRKLLESNEELAAFARDELGLSDFSLGGYLCKTLIPWMDQEADVLSEDTVFEIMSLIASEWATLSDDERESIGKGLPVILAHAGVRSRSALEGNELVFPRAFDPELGWQLVFLSHEEMEHSDVLSDRYVTISEDLEVVHAILSELGATDLPDSQELSLTKRATREGPLPDYCKFAFARQTEPYTQAPRVTTLLPPSIVFNPDIAGERMKRNRLALLAWIEGMLEWNESGLKEGWVQWFYYSSRFARVPSAVSWALQHEAWLPTSAGPKIPSECFRPSKQLKEMFGNALPILQDRVSDEVCQFLGIQQEITSETVLRYLESLSKHDTDKSLAEHETELNQVVQLYEYLEKYGEEFKQAFEESSLIYLPGSSKRWFTSTEVVWDDLSSVFGDVYPCLSGVYEARSLRGFFVSKLGVHVSVGAKQLAQAWIRLCEQSNPDREKVEAALERIMPALLSTASSEDPLPDWWADFAASVEVWTHDRVFHEPSESFAGDDDVLRRKFQASKYFIWKPDSRSHQEMMPLYRALEVPLISESVEVQLKSASKITSVPEPKVLTDLSKKLICYYAFSESAEAFEELLHSGLLANLLKLTEAQSSLLDVVYRIEASGTEVSDDERCAFLDLSREQLILRSGEYYDEWLDETAEGISKLLWGRKWRSHADTIRTLLAISGETRYSKLRQKRGWRMPRSLSKEIESLLGSQESPAYGSDGDGRRADAEGTGDQTITAGDRDIHSGEGAPKGQQVDSSEHDRMPVGRTARRGRQPKSTTHSEGQRGARGEGRTAEGGSTSGARQDSQQPRGRSRSTEVTRRINQFRQSRLITYVVGGDAPTAKEKERAQDEERYDQNKALGDAAEEVVLQDEIMAGRAAERMSPNFPGYDIRSVDESTGEVRFIEVKGQIKTWGARGVGLTARQFNEAKEKLESYWLYVVENACGPNPRVTRIRNPAARVTEFRFDEGWRQLAESKSLKQRPDDEFRSELERLKSLLTDNKCKDFIDFCGIEDLEFPEVGFELMDESDRVVAEAELAWPSARVAILSTTQYEDREKFESYGWTVLLSSAEAEEIRPLVRHARATDD